MRQWHYDDHDILPFETEMGQGRNGVEGKKRAVDYVVVKIRGFEMRDGDYS